MSGKRKKYTPEFREQAARLVIETGRPVAHVAAEIGVGEQLLGRWVRLAREAAGADDNGAVLDADERATRCRGAVITIRGNPPLSPRPRSIRHRDESIWGAALFVVGLIDAGLPRYREGQMR